MTKRDDGTFASERGYFVTKTFGNDALPASVHVPDFGEDDTETVLQRDTQALFDHLRTAGLPLEANIEFDEPFATFAPG